MTWFEKSHPQIKKEDNVAISQNSGYLKSKVDEVCFLLNMSYKQYLKLLNKGFDEERARKLSGLSDQRSFFFAYTFYHNTDFFI